MQVSTSNSGRSAGVANRTPLVATHRHAERRRQVDERVVVGFFVAAEMPLQLDVDAIAAEDADEAIEQAADAVAPAVERGAADERDEAAASRRRARRASSAPSPFGARSFIRVIRRQRLR